MNKKILIFTLIALLVSVGYVQADNQRMKEWLKNEVKQQNKVKNVKIKESYTNWQNYTIEATGYAIAPDTMSGEQAKLMAREGAIAIAQRNLVAKIKGLNINSTTKVKDKMAISDKINRDIQGFLKGADIVKEIPVGNRAYKVKMKVDILGKEGMAKYLFPKDRLRKNKNTNNKEINPMPDKNKSKPKQEQNIKEYTSIILNVTNKRVSNALYPKILSETNKVLYGLNTLNQESFNRSIVQYSKSLAEAKTLTTAGDTPLIITTNKVSGEHHTDIVLSPKKAQNFLKYGKGNNLLQKNKIIIVTNR